MKKTTILLCSSLLLLVCLNAPAGGIFRFDDLSVNGSDWMDGQNWRVQTAGDIKGCLPGAEDTVRFNYGGRTGFLASDAGTIAQLQIGIDDKGGKLILNPGAKLVISGSRNYIGWKGREDGGTLIVNGGTLTYGGWVSVAGERKGVFVLNAGTVRVENVFCHDLYEEGGQALTRIQGGVLDVNSMKLHSGTLDISGGLVRIRADISEALILEWLKGGLITINGQKGAMRGINYTLKPWGTAGLEISIVEKPETQGMLTF